MIKYFSIQRRYNLRGEEILLRIRRKVFCLIFYGEQSSNNSCPHSLFYLPALILYNEASCPPAVPPSVDVNMKQLYECNSYAEQQILLIDILDDGTAYMLINKI